MSFPRYEKYKDSGVEWLGEVPEHWIVRKGSYIGRLFGSDSVAESMVSDQGKLPFLKVGTLSHNSLDIQKPDFFVDRLLEDQHEPNKNFIVFPKRGAAIFLNKVNVVKDRSLLDPNLMGWQIFSEGSIYFFAYALKCRGLKELADVSTVPQINNKHIAPTKFPFPSLLEQTQIAHFLNHETARIDALIAEQERLIALLKEKRQAVISHAVTKGCDSTVRMKDSGVEWLGEVPEHWEIAKVKYAVQKFEQGWSPQCENVPVDDELQWGVLKVGCVNGGSFSAEENKKLPESLEPLPELSIKSGDILISRANTRELVGSSALVDSDYSNLMISDKLFRLRTTNRMLPRYLVFYLGTNSVRHQIELEATGASSSMLNIGQSVIKELHIPVPPLIEQNDIADRLNSSLNRLRRLRHEAEATQDLLKERRSALISAAVTGKIDVRNWQPPADTPSNTATALQTPTPSLK